MGSVEIATAYLAIVPSAKGMGAKLGAEIGGPLEDAAKKSGERASQGFADVFKKRTGQAMVVAGGLLTKGFVDSMSFEAGNDKLAAQLGATPEKAKQLGKAAGDLYSQNFGDSMGQVDEAISAVIRNVGGMRDASARDLKDVTASVLNVATAFDVDLGGTTNAVGQMMKTGLAANATQALDIITRGFQTGADKAGDLLDTLNEYGTQFRKLGLDGATAMGIITQGLQGGARDADIVADAIKEFSIRAIDGSDTTAQGFKLIGVNAKQMAADISKGGPSASAALDQVFDRLRAMKDPVKQSAAAVALFGTQAEDLGAALFTIDPSGAVAALGQVEGAATRMGNTLGDNTAGKLESFKRRAQLALAGVGDAVGPVLAVAPGLGGLVTVSDKLGPAFSKLGSGAASLATGVASGAASLASWAASSAVATARAVAQTVAIVAQKAAQLAAAAATNIVTAAQWLLNAAMSANPLALIVIAIAAFVAALVLAYNKVGWFRDFIQAAMRVVGAVVSAVVDTIAAVIRGFVALWAAEWNAVAAVVSAVAGAVRAVISAVVGAVRAAASAVSSAFQAVVGAVSGAISGLINLVRGLPGRVLSGLGNLGGLLVEAGKDIIRGLIKGVQNMAGAIADAAKRVVTGAVDGVKHFLHIGSPSKLFATIGTQTMDGFRVGLESQYRTVRSSLAGFVDSLAGGPVTAPLVATAGGSVTAGGRAARTAQGATGSPLTGPGGAPVRLTVESTLDGAVVARSNVERAGLVLATQGH